MRGVVNIMVEPSSVGLEARKREDENIKFRSFLKNRADCDELDRQFLELHNELFTGYDCCKYNNCCREYSTILQESDVESISSFLGLSKQEFSEKHLNKSTDGIEIKTPCCFLKGNGECAIQECKPEECRDFPHTDKPDRLFSLHGVLSFAEVCPVVFEILERLKVVYGFRTRW